MLLRKKLSSLALLLAAMNVLMISSCASMEASETYVVHMEKTKMQALDTSLADTSTTTRWYEAVIESITTLSEIKDTSSSPSSLPQLLYVYENSLFGFSAKLSNKHLRSLKQIDGFITAIEDELLSLHTTHSPHFLGLRPSTGLWDRKNLASDVIIGVVDTGIWPEHPSFHGSEIPSLPPAWWRGACEDGPEFPASKCNGKLVGARAFFKGYESIAGRINETSDYRSPRDSEGHGTHTASTCAGNYIKGANFSNLAKGSAAGMRYTSRIAAYKACYQLGCASSDILAAIEQGVSDGVDVLSLSLGGSSKPYDRDNLAIAAFGAIKNGIFVSFSAGNSGPLDSTVSNVAPWILTVAASYTDRSFPTTVKLGDDRVFPGASLYSGKPTKKLPLAYAEEAGSSKEAKFCTGGSLDPKLVKGKIVICDRGINSRVEKGEIVKNAGGLGMILANNENQGEELFADPHLLPATSLGAKASNYVKAYLNNTSGHAKAKIAFEGTVFDERAPIMAAFSARGPSAVDPNVIKPDVTGPGVNILAAWPPNISPTQLASDKRSLEFNIISGTSMSCPHLSGLAALIKSRHENWSPGAIKSALMTASYVRDNRDLPISDSASDSGSENFAGPFAFGSGHVEPERASDPGLVYDVSPEDYLTYLCGLNYNSTQMSLFSPGNFTCPNGPGPRPENLNYPSFAVSFMKNAKNATVTYRRKVTNVGIPASSYVASTVVPEGVSVVVEPKVLRFRGLGEKLSYEVSFIADGGEGGDFPAAKYSFGSLTWISGKYYVRSPIAVTWL